MARIRPINAYKHERVDLEVQIIEAITRIGPRNVSEISRVTKAPVETIRYKIKKQLKNLGFRIHAEPNYKKMGLTLFWAKISFTPQHLTSAPQILNALNELGYLVYYGKVVPHGYYSALFALPDGRGDEYKGFLKYTQDIGVVQDFALVESLHTQHHSMNPRYFNFQTGKWEIDWEKVAMEKVRGDDDKQSKTETAVDGLDLLLVKELQIDALQHVVAIARKLKIHPKTLEYHYRAHVEGLNLIPRYIVRWMNDLDKSPPHSLVVTRLTLDGMSKDDSLRMKQATNKIPFLWSEDNLSDGTYVAWLMIPLEETTTTFDFIHTSVPDLSTRMNVGFIKHWDTAMYSVPHHMFSKRWSFDVEEMKVRFKKVIAELARKEAGKAQR
ncbi:MAG: hypothetical protein HYU03_07920 [Thaumarchaeota archaeon]|nr:hypothetical protein [Nitrososphaerota archaeon]